MSPAPISPHQGAAGTCVPRRPPSRCHSLTGPCMPRGCLMQPSGASTTPQEVGLPLVTTSCLFAHSQAVLGDASVASILSWGLQSCGCVLLPPPPCSCFWSLGSSAERLGPTWTPGAQASGSSKPCFLSGNTVLAVASLF